MLNHVTWTPLASFTHTPPVRGPADLVGLGRIRGDGAWLQLHQRNDGRENKQTLLEHWFCPCTARFGHHPKCHHHPGQVAYVEELEDEMGRRVLAENTGSVSSRPTSRAGGGRAGSRPGSPSKGGQGLASSCHPPSPTKHLRPDGTLKDLDDEGEPTKFRWGGLVVYFCVEERLLNTGNHTV